MSNVLSSKKKKKYQGMITYNKLDIQLGTDKQQMYYCSFVMNSIF